MSKKKPPMKPPSPPVVAVLSALNARAEKIGVSRADLSRRTGIHPAHVTTTLGGKKGLSVEALTQYSDALGLRILPEEAAGLPLLGTVSAGPGAVEPAEVGQFVHLHTLFAAASGVYLVQGTSMIAAGVLPGDLLAVQLCPSPDSGLMVVAWVRDVGMVVKRFKVGPKGRRELHSEDGTGADRHPILIGPDDVIYGVLVGVIRTPDKAVPPPEPKAPAKARARPPAKK